MLAKERVENNLLSPVVRQNRSVIDKISLIFELTKQNDILEREVNLKQQEIVRMQDTLLAKHAEQRQELFSLSILVNQLTGDDDARDLEAIFFDEDNQQVEARRNVADLNALLRFLYTFDPMVAPDPPTLRIIEQHTADWAPNN